MEGHATRPGMPRARREGCQPWLALSPCGGVFQPVGKSRGLAKRGVHRRFTKSSKDMELAVSGAVDDPVLWPRARCWRHPTVEAGRGRLWRIR